MATGNFEYSSKIIVSIPKEEKYDDDINVLTLGGDYLTVNQAVCIIRTWLATEFKQGRYQERIQMIEEIEKENMK